MDITKWKDTWKKIDWKNASEEKIKQKITKFYHAGVDFNMEGQYEEWTSKPVFFATAFSTVGVVDLLIDGGADITLTNKDGNTALHWAAANGRTEKVKYIIEHGPSNTVKFVNRQNNLGITALYLAAIYGYEETVKALINIGADVNIKDNNDDTALHQAACYGRVDIVKALIEHGANVNITDSDGNTALDIAENEEIEKLIENAKKIRAAYLKKHPQGSLQQTLGKASVKKDKMSLVKKQKTR